jgi:Domain of unknown function (DUF4142)
MFSAARDGQGRKFVPIARMEAMASAAGIAATRGAANGGQVRGKSQPEWPRKRLESRQFRPKRALTSITNDRLTNNRNIIPKMSGRNSPLRPSCASQFLFCHRAALPMTLEQQKNVMKISSPPIFAAFAALSLTCMPHPATASDKASVARGEVKVASTDEKFMLAAAQGGTLEVRLGEVAKKKATRQDVKEFGAMMVTDHGKAGEELKAVAAKNGQHIAGIILAAGALSARLT